MKVKKQNKDETNVHQINKKKIKKDIVSKVEVTNDDGGNVIKKLKKEKNKEVNGKNSIDGYKKKNKNKLEKLVEKTDAVENIKNVKKGKKEGAESNLVKPVTSIKDVTKGKKSEKKISLKPDMTSSELLRTLESTLFAKKENNQEKSKKNKVNSNKSEDIGEPLVKSKKIAEISDSSADKQDKIKKLKSVEKTVEQSKKVKNVLKALESTKALQNGTQETSEGKPKKLAKKNNIKSEEVKKTAQPHAEKKKVIQKGSDGNSDATNKQMKKAVNKPKKLEKANNKNSKKLDNPDEASKKNIGNADSDSKKKNKQDKKSKKYNKESKPKTKSNDEQEENEITDSKNTSSVGTKQKFGKADKVKKIENKKQQKVLGMNQRLVPSLKDASKFDEGTFNDILNVNNIEKTVEILTKLVKKETDAMKNVIFKDYRYVLNLALFKIPSAPKRIVKLKVKHSIVASDDDVLFIVKDLKRGARLDYEPTKHHYEDLIRDRGIEGIKAVMPFNQLKKEYSSYEMKRKLSNLYDYFICDGSIAGHVFAFLGKIFASKSRGILYSVRVDGKDLKKEIKKALYKTGFRQGAKGDVISIIVGNHTQSAKQVAENCLDIIEQLKTLLPGGHPNIRNVTIKCNLKGTSALPLYLSMGKPPRDTPYVIGAKEQKLNKLKERAEEILAKFAITNTGSIEKITPEEIQQRKRKRDEIKSKVEAKKLKSMENGGETEVKLNNKKKEKKNKKKEVEIEPELIELEEDDSESDDPDFELNSNAEDITVAESDGDDSDNDEDSD